MGIVHDLQRLSETEIEQDGKRYVLRNTAPDGASTVLRTLGVALPPLVRCAQPPPPHHNVKNAAENPAAVVPTPVLRLLTP